MATENLGENQKARILFSFFSLKLGFELGWWGTNFGDTMLLFSYSLMVA